MLAVAVTGNATSVVSLWFTEKSARTFPAGNLPSLVALGLLAARAWGATPDTDALEARSA